MRAMPVPDVLDRERGTDVPRDIQDSFGFVSNHLTDFSLLPHGRRLSYRPRSHLRFAPRFRAEEEIAYIADMTELEAQIARRGEILCVAQMSDMFAPFLSPIMARGAGWEQHLSIIVGDEVPDRLLFWNTVHRYRTLVQPGNYQVLRFSPHRFANGIPDWIARLCSGQRNYRHLNGNAAPSIVVRSCSVHEDELNRIARQFDAVGRNMAVGERHAHPSVFEPLDHHVRLDQRGRPQLHGASIWNDPSTGHLKHIRFERHEFEVPIAVPEHLRETPLVGTTQGTWAADLRIDRHEDHSQYDNLRHRWIFPRRLRLDSAVRVENYGGDFLVLPRPRPSGQGDLVIWDNKQWTRPTVHMPSDIAAFATAVALHHPETRADFHGNEHARSPLRFTPVEISDKGRDLLGVFQLFRSLPEALRFLTNDYLLSIIEKLCPTEPSENPRRVNALTGEIRDAFERHNDPEVDFERLAKRVLSLAGRWVLADNKQNAFISYERLRNELPDALRNDAGREDLEDSVKYLRNRGFLQQGYGWTCSRCQYRN
jgi:hypothetical protein